MRNAILPVVLVGVAMSVAASPLAPAQAREAFEKPWRGAFAGAVLKPAEVAGTTNDWRTVDGEWLFALPFEDDPRLRFVRATVEKGAFQSGTLHYFGLEPMPLTAADFAALRRDFPMVARRAKPSPTSVATLYPPTARPLDKPVPPTAKTDLRMVPFGELYGGFLDVAARRLRLKADGIRYEISHVSPGGERLVLGVVRNSRGEEALSEEQVLAKPGEAHPELISDRERADYLLKGRFAYRAL